MELKERIETLKAKGMTIREIKEILNISNHDYYESTGDPISEENPKDKENPKLDAGQRTTTEEKESPAQGFTKPSQKGNEEQKDNTEKKAEPKTGISDKFATIKISSNRAVNDLARQQEMCIEELIATIDKPFKNQWEWQEWEREAIALQLSSHTTNDFFIENMAMWDSLLEGHADRDRRAWNVFLMTNFLVKTFAQARAELQYSERGEKTE
jgi:DNA-binding transcriptional MerR regulator